MVGGGGIRKGKQMLMFRDKRKQRPKRAQDSRRCGERGKDEEFQGQQGVLLTVTAEQARERLLF